MEKVHVYIEGWAVTMRIVDHELLGNVEIVNIPLGQDCVLESRPRLITPYEDDLNDWWQW